MRLHRRVPNGGYLGGLSEQRWCSDSSLIAVGGIPAAPRRCKELHNANFLIFNLNQSHRNKWFSKQRIRQIFHLHQKTSIIISDNLRITFLLCRYTHRGEPIPSTNEPPTSTPLSGLPARLLSLVYDSRG